MRSISGFSDELAARIIHVMFISVIIMMTSVVALQMIEDALTNS